MKRLEAYCLKDHETEEAFLKMLKAEGYYESHGHIGAEIDHMEIADIVHTVFYDTPYVILKDKDWDKKAYARLKRLIEHFGLLF
jgi:hypothetical protein